MRSPGNSYAHASRETPDLDDEDRWSLHNPWMAQINKTDTTKCWQESRPTTHTSGVGVGNGMKPLENCSAVSMEAK